MCGRYFILANHPKLTEIIEKAQKASPSVPFQLSFRGRRSVLSTYTQFTTIHNFNS